MKRLLTAAIGTPLVLALVFLAPSPAFFAAMALVMMVAGWEYAEIVRPRLPGMPRWPLLLLLPLIPAAAWALSFAMIGDGQRAVAALRLLLFGGALLLSIGLGTLLLLAGTPLEETLPALGALGFGVLYFALPLSSLHLLQRLDPWIIFLLLAIVWLGDTAAYYVGSRFGRHKMAPVISPKKSWEGAAASFAAAVLSAAVWDYCRRGTLEPGLLAVAAATAVAAQIGDLVESMIKRGSGVKDSGNILPGHGGILDRMDALLFGAPVLLIGLWLLGIGFPG